MVSAEAGADCLARDIRIRPDIAINALRFYGEWDGIPFDARYRVESVESVADVLTISFAGGERLTITAPSDYVWQPRTGPGRTGPLLVIRTARVVRWEFPRASRPRDRLYHIEYTHSDGRIRIESDVDWFTPRIADKRAPALELH